MFNFLCGVVAGLVVGVFIPTAGPAIVAWAKGLWSKGTTPK